MARIGVGTLKTWLMVVPLLVLCGISFECAEASSRDQRLAEASDAWKKLRDGLLIGFQVEQHTRWGSPERSDGGGSSKKGGEYTVALHKCGENELARSTFTKGPRQGVRVEAVNDLYAFNLTGNSNPEPSAWMLTSLSREPGAAKSKRYGTLDANSIVFYGIMVEGDWLENLVTAPSFEVVEFKDGRAAGGKREVEVTFRSKHPVDDANTVLGGVIRLAPDSYWVLNGYDIESQSRTMGRGRAGFEYQDLAGYPFLKRRAMTYEFEGDAPIQYVDEFSQVARCDLDRSAFTLSAFGMPEPGAIATNPRRRWITMLVIGLLLITMGWLLRKRSRAHLDDVAKLSK